MQTLTDAEQFNRDGVDFLNYLKICRGKLGIQTDEELTRMQKTCASILGFVHNHPEQLPGCAASASITCPPPASC